MPRGLMVMDSLLKTTFMPSSTCSETRRVIVEARLATRPEDVARVVAWRAQVAAIKARYAGVADEPIPPRLDLKSLLRGVPGKWRSRLRSISGPLNLSTRGRHEV